MNQKQWERLQDLFSKAVELSPAERAAFVAFETTHDPQLSKELLELLGSDPGDSTGPLTHALRVALNATTRERREALVGAIIGNYRIVAVLGYGGTGTVYLAERADRQYSAQVAIKVVDTATVLGDLGARLRAERQILASLNHPNISRLLDAGETDAGQPYLVMEYIQGEQLDRYADRAKLDLKARLKLFLEICSPVQYAHQNLVVHRDLKPANILVTSDGVLKLLDFGIAKLLDSADSGAVVALTRVDDRVLTPEYASPEQILGQPVTTASDVYALGAVLYELLTGVRPYHLPMAASLLELERLICASDPERPSAAIRRLKSPDNARKECDVAAFAQARRLSAEKLCRRLRGDLDAIVMRALRKDPQDRYGSVEQFAADVRRYLASEPVAARQGNWGYYSKRFMRRYAFGATAGAMFLAAGIAFAIAMSFQTKRIAAERDRATQESGRAETVSNFMLEVFSAPDLFASQDHETTARELLDNAARRIKSDLTQQPEARARLLEAIGKSYRRQNENAQARQILEEALHLRRQLPDPDGSKTASVLVQLAMTQRIGGQRDTARTMLEEAARRLDAAGNVRSLTYASVMQELGRVELEAGRLSRARKILNASLALHRDLLGPTRKEVASVLSDLVTLALWNDDLTTAERLARQTLDIYEQTVPELYPDRVTAESVLAQVLQSEGAASEAAVRLERVLEHEKFIYGETSLQVAGVYNALADAQMSQGHLDAAEHYSRECVTVNIRTRGEEHYQTAYVRAVLAEILMKRGALEEAESLLRHSLETYSKTLPPDHQFVASAEYFLGEVLLREGRLVDAERVLIGSVSRWKRLNAAPWRSMRSESALGEVLYRQRRYKEAERHLVESYKALVSDEKADRDTRIQARERLTHFYQARGHLEKLHTFPSLSQNRQPSPQPQ